MGLIAYLLALAITGLVVGGLARLALPGKDPLSLLQTMAVGIAAALVAGVIGSAIFGRGAGGIVLAVLVATGFVYLIRRRRGGSFTRASPRVQR